MALLMEILLSTCLCKPREAKRSVIKFTQKKKLKKKRIFRGIFFFYLVGIVCYAHRQAAAVTE